MKQKTSLKFFAFKSRNIEIKERHGVTRGDRKRNQKKSEDVKLEDRKIKPRDKDWHPILLCMAERRKLDPHS